MLVRALALGPQRALSAATGGGHFLGRHADLRACGLNWLFIGASLIGDPRGSQLMHDLLEYVTGRCLACEGRSRKVDCHGRAGKSIVHVASSERSEGDPENGSRSDSDSAVLDGADRRSRFDLREGHDLERLLWPRNG